jgi:hypothetical protein
LSAYSSIWNTRFRCLGSDGPHQSKNQTQRKNGHSQDSHFHSFPPDAVYPPSLSLDRDRVDSRLNVDILARAKTKRLTGIGQSVNSRQQAWFNVVEKLS